MTAVMHVEDLTQVQLQSHQQRCVHSHTNSPIYLDRKGAAGNAQQYT